MGAGFDLDGKMALITGAAGGIGGGIAEVLAEAGALVVIADIDAPRAEAQAEAIRARGGKADWVALDLADEASVAGAVSEVVAKHGAPWLLVNNAGLQNREYLFDETVASWDRTHAVNTRGVFLTMREAGKAMVAAGGGGRIVNIASTAVWGMAVKGSTAYTSSKGAVVAMGLAAALELTEHGITVNTVLPGGVATPGSIGATGPRPEGPGCRPPPLGMVEPRDIGAAVLFFAAPAAHRVTNQVLAVDAGWSIA